MNMKLPDRIVVVGIGTDVGKTVTSAVLCQQFGYDYWKPVQTGNEASRDTRFLFSNLPDLKFVPEAYHFQLPASPHLAAREEGKQIETEKLFLLPPNERLLIETAGGIMVPLNDKGELNIDLLQKWNLPVIVVVRHYLGSINHTLLTLEILKSRNVKIAGVIFNGEEYSSSEEIIRKAVPEPDYFRLPQLQNLSEVSSVKIEKL